MARVTVEDCIDKVDSPYELVLVAKERATQMGGKNAKAVLVSCIDSSQKKSILLKPPISQKTSSFTSTHPFDSAIWKPGSYILELEYSGAQSSTQFSIQDTGEVSIPFWIKDLAKMWVTQPLVTDKDFGRAIGYLIQHEVIKIPYTEPEGDSITNIPDWVKTNAEWWVTGKISDTEFTVALQYLIKKGIILVNLPTV